MSRTLTSELALPWKAIHQGYLRPPGIGLPIHQDCLAGDAEWPGIHLETAPLRAQASMAAVWLVGWKVPAQPLAFQFSLISSADSKRRSFSLPYCASVSVRKVCRRKGKLYPTDTEKISMLPITCSCHDHHQRVCLAAQNKKNVFFIFACVLAIVDFFRGLCARAPPPPPPPPPPAFPPGAVQVVIF